MIIVSNSKQPVNEELVRQSRRELYAAVDFDPNGTATPRELAEALGISVEMVRAEDFPDDETLAAVAALAQAHTDSWRAYSPKTWTFYIRGGMSEAKTQSAIAYQLAAWSLSFEETVTAEHCDALALALLTQTGVAN